MEQNKVEFDDVSDWLASIIERKNGQRDVCCTYFGHDAKISVIFVGLGRNRPSTIWHYERLIEKRAKNTKNVLLLAKGPSQCKLAEAAVSLWRLKNKDAWHCNIHKYFDTSSKTKKKIITMDILLTCNSYKDVFTREFHENYKGPKIEFPLHEDVNTITDELDMVNQKEIRNRFSIKKQIWTAMRKMISR